MTEKQKESLKIILSLYKNDVLNEEELFTLMEVILDKNCCYYPYYPVTITEPHDNKPITPWYEKDKYTKYGDLFKPYCDKTSDVPFKYDDHKYYYDNFKNSHTYTTTNTLSDIEKRKNNKMDNSNKKE